MGKKRSVALIRDKSKDELANLRVEFDEQWMAIGDNKDAFTTYRGVITRKMISILIESWDKVEQRDKDQLWLNIKDYWNIPNDGPKKQVLRDCNTSWRAYKTTLLKLKDNNRHPLQEYPYLEKNMYRAFVAQKSTKEFQVKRRKGRELAKMNNNHPRVGRAGYHGKAAEWAKEVESGVTIKGHHIKSERARHYIFSRRRRDSLGNMTLPPSVEPVADEIIQKDIQASQGDIELGPRSDVLTEVMGPEHSGRTRAVRHNIGSKELGIFEKKRKRHDIQDFEDMYVMMKDRWMAEMGDELVAKVVAALKNQDTNGPILNELHKITEPTCCELLLPYGKVRPALAKGTLHPTEVGQILEAGHLRVLVDSIHGQYQSFPLPVLPTDDISSLGQALHSIIQWPQDSIVLLKKDKRPSIPPSVPIPSVKDKGPTKPVSAKSVPVQAKSVPVQAKSVPVQVNSAPVSFKRTKPAQSAPILGDQVEETTDNLGIQSFRKWYLGLQIEEPFRVIAEPGMFNDETTIYISSAVILEILNREQIDVSGIMWYQMILHSMVSSLANGFNRCAFISPQSITASLCEYDKNNKTKHVVNHITAMFNFHEGRELFLAPYWESAHWMLIVICPHQREGYILDSKRGSKKLQDYTIVKHVEKAVAVFTKKSKKSLPSKMIWKFPKCNQQKSNWECG